MRENDISEKAMIVFSVALLVIILGAFAWIWFGTSRPSADVYKSTENLQPISVANFRNQAKKLLDGLQNNSGMPILEPTAKEGRDDPFASL